MLKQAIVLIVPMVGSRS